MPTAFDKAVEENERLKEKLNDLHEQNASLASQNRYLKNRVETTNLELMESKTRVCIFNVFCSIHLSYLNLKYSLQFFSSSKCIICSVIFWNRGVCNQILHEQIIYI